MTVSVICVDADETDRERTAAALETLPDLTLTTCARAADARTELTTAAYDCLVTEYELPDGTGLDLVAVVREQHPDMGCVLFTDTPFADIDTDAHPHLVVDHLSKEAPADYDYLPELVASLTTDWSHTAYPLPSDEGERLAALQAYDVDGLATVDAFDRLTELAARQFDVVFAFVGLVDAHEERFVSCYGADWDSLPREKTVCTYAILESDVMVVENIQEDPRFATNEVLAELGIHSYAGAKIEAADGEAIGMFCVLDDTPRTYTEKEKESLRLFAAEAADQLELRRRLTAGGDQW